MKVVLACTRKSTNLTFHEVYTLTSSVLTTPEQAIPALRQMIELMDPDVEVLGGEEIIEVRRGFYH